MSILTDLQAALPGKTITLTPTGGYEFNPPCSTPEWAIAEAILDPVRGKAVQSKLDILGIPIWATWTQAQFAQWCIDNLMTDLEIDGSALSAPLKKNIKAINVFIRNGGKMLIAQRDIVFWLLRINGANGS